MATTDFTEAQARLRARIEKIRENAQNSLFSLGENTPESENDTEQRPKRPHLLPVRHPQRDFFLCDMFDYAFKDDGVSMEAPIFTLSTKPDLDIVNFLDN